MGSTESERRNLVVVRAGEKSLHRGWLGGSRNWDIIVSWYGEGPYVPVADEEVIEAKGWKWNILARHFAERPDLLAKYDYFWLPDDDIEASGESINRIFELAREHRLEVCQPSLTLDSYFTVGHTLNFSSFLLRYSSFVEVMVPCLSRAAVERSVRYWSISPAGFGIDLVWSRLEPDNVGKSAILDAVTVRHTRPVGQFLKGRMTAAGFDPYADWRLLMRRFDLTAPRQFYSYAGISAGGVSRGRFATARHMFRDLWMNRDQLRTTTQGTVIFKGFEHVFKRARLKQIFDRGEET